MARLLSLIDPAGGIVSTIYRGRNVASPSPPLGVDGSLPVDLMVGRAGALPEDCQPARAARAPYLCLLPRRRCGLTATNRVSRRCQTHLFSRLLP